MGSRLSPASEDADEREAARPGTRPPRVKGEKLATFLSLSLGHWHWDTSGPGGAGLKAEKEADQASLAGGARGEASLAPCALSYREASQQQETLDHDHQSTQQS